jgi:serine/threonine protein kinase
LDWLADEFAARCRKGESPSIAEYAAAHPRLAGRIAELFPAVAMLERWRIDERATRRAVSVRDRFARPPEQLGDFVILRELGRGGMGIVYEAEQRSLARRVAVKILPKHVLLLDKHLKRFQREAQTAARLRHTNIVPVFGAGEHEGLHYYVMPLVRGVGLDEVIRALRETQLRCADKGGTVSLVGDSTPPTLDPPRRRRWLRGKQPVGVAARYDSAIAGAIVRELIAGKFPDAAPNHVGVIWARSSTGPAAAWRWAAEIGLQGAEALQYAHAQGTLHRDIKPGNLLIDEDGGVCVADFGLARAVDREGTSQTSEVAGTLRYMAPEQLRGAADARSDVYALGLTMYELLTLQPAAASPAHRPDSTGRPVSLEPIPPRKIDATIPRDLETIVLTCLAAEPARRYQSAEALATDLRCCLQDRPIRARRASWSERAGRWCRRNPALAAMSALAGLLLVAFAVMAVTSSMRTRTAYAKATQSLVRAEATSQLARQALDDIYVQLSPDRVRIAANADRDGDVRPLPLRPGMQVAASPEVASVLENLLVFYDRLAEQSPLDHRVLLESAIAGRRVGDIRQRLGQLDQAEREYRRVADRLATLPVSTDVAVPIEQARAHNEIGNVCSARFEFGRAHESHRHALSILRSVEPASRSSEDYRYELARTLYFLAGKRLGAMDTRRDGDARENLSELGPHYYKSSEYRKAAIAMLEELSRRHPADPDYRFLLALCHRLSGIGPPTDRSVARVSGRRRAMQVLEELKTEYPQAADYRYELAVTCASVSVGLFPGEDGGELSATAEPSLLRALDELSWLVAHRPAIPEYARYRSLALAKLGMFYWRTERLAEAEDLFEQAFRTQAAVVSGFPGLPSQHRVQLELIRLRWAQVCLARGTDADDRGLLERADEHLNRCIAQLTELTARPELARDELAWTILPLAHQTLSEIHDEPGSATKVQETASGGRDTCPASAGHGP